MPMAIVAAQALGGFEPNPVIAFFRYVHMQRRFYRVPIVGVSARPHENPPFDSRGENRVGRS